MSSSYMSKLCALTIDSTYIAEDTRSNAMPHSFFILIFGIFECILEVKKTYFLINTTKRDKNKTLLKSKIRNLFCDRVQDCEIQK